MVDVTLITAGDRDKELGFDEEILAFTWKCKEIDFAEGVMLLKLNFSQPAQISPLKIQDTLMINMSRVFEGFISVMTNLPLDEESRVI